MKLKIHGTVQKVGFRYSVLTFIEQNRLPVVGYIQNLPDGSVEILAQGDIESLKSLHRFASHGPEQASVREMKEEISEINKLTFEAFELIS